MLLSLTDVGLEYITGSLLILLIVIHCELWFSIKLLHIFIWLSVKAGNVTLEYCQMYEKIDCK